MSLLSSVLLSWLSAMFFNIMNILINVAVNVGVEPHDVDVFIYFK